MLGSQTIDESNDVRARARHIVGPGGRGTRVSLSAAIAFVVLSTALPADRCNAQTSLASERLNPTNVYETVGRLYGVDPGLLQAIAQVESGGYARALSPKGAQGLMQLTPSTAREFEVDEPFDPVENVLGAARFLVFLEAWLSMRDTFAPTLPYLLAAYNAGPGAVEKYRGIPPFQETREYVRKVLTVLLLQGASGSSIARNTPISRTPVVRTSTRSTSNRARLDEQWLSQLEEVRRERQSSAISGFQFPGN